jgi:hypothetical protein
LNYHILLLGYFNVPDFDWDYCLPSPNSHFYTKINGDLIHSGICFLGLNQHKYPENGSNLLGFFSNFVDLSVEHAEYGPVQSDHFRLLLFIAQYEFSVSNKTVIREFLIRDFPL